MMQPNPEQEFILKITEEDYQQGLKKGWTDEDMLPLGEHKFRHVLPEGIRSNSSRDSGKNKVAKRETSS
jgi:hypothetical protein